MSTSPADARRQRTERELLAIAKQLPVPVLPEGRSEEMRTAFLATVRDARSTKRARALAARGRGRLLLVAAMLLAGAGFAAAAWRITRGTQPAGPIHAVAPGVGGREARGVRGRGTAEVPAAPVQRSVVASTLAQAGPARLGQTPPRRDVPPRDVPPREVPLRSTRRLAVASTAARVSQANVEMAFARGWSALRTNDFEAAAESFGQAASERDDNALSEDALFWRGVALDRAHRLPEAQEALTRFLVRYPKSDRVGEAAVMLGWLLLRAGDATAADARFGSALGDPSERVRRSARAGLAASGRHRAP
ncbi:MAG TPA: tetratricopeptide repeat protein [Polyangia bacterium]|nr:tetratricopeptide repeat protein [Polyangia bacterium]